MLDEHLLAGSRLESVGLRVEILLSGGDSGVTDRCHDRIVPLTCLTVHRSRTRAVEHDTRIFELTASSVSWTVVNEHGEPDSQRHFDDNRLPEVTFGPNEPGESPVCGTQLERHCFDGMSRAGVTAGACARCRG